MPASLSAELARIAAECHALATFILSVERLDAEHFKGSIVANPPAGRADLIVVGGALATRGFVRDLPALDVHDVRALLAWTRGRLAVTRFYATFRGAGAIDAQLHELVRVLEARPLRVEVWRSRPTSERGEPSAGQPSIRVVVDAGGVEVESMLDSALTSDDDHPRVEATFVERGEALARELGVECKLH